MEWGGKREFLSSLAANGQRVTALENRPSLTPWIAGYYEAFMVLGDSRPVYMGGLGPIQLTEIAAYCGLYGITDPDEVDDFLYMIRALDTEYLTLLAERRKREDSKADVAGSKVPARPRGRMRNRR